VQETIQSKNDEDQAKQDAGDQDGDLHSLSSVAF
jgi:hypothetical protein